jgi:hypothetical protein
MFWQKIKLSKVSSSKVLGNIFSGEFSLRFAKDVLVV